MTGEGGCPVDVEPCGVNLFAALRRIPEDDMPAQPTDEDLLAWAEELRTTYEPRRRRPLVAAPID
jgi:hypothetical protein